MQVQRPGKLNADDMIRVQGEKTYMRIGASFSNPINRIVHIKTLKQNWQK